MAKDKELTHDEKLAKVKELMKDSKIGLLTTIAERGLVSRPMALQKTEFDGDVWFITYRDTPKVQEIKADPRVNVSFSDDNENFVSLAGRAEIVEDEAKKKELWNKAYEAVFHTEADDPDLILIKVDAHGAEYWESGSKVRTAFQFVTSMLGNKDHEDLGENESVDL